MGQILDFNAASNILKQRYESKPVETAFLKEHQALADVPKDPTKGGAAWNIAFKYAVMSTRATTVPNALANGAPDQYGKFTITNGLYNDYAVMQLSNIARDEAMQGGEDAMVKLADETLEGGYLSAYDSVAAALWGNGGGSRGQILSTSTVNTTTITLADPSQVLKFRPGMVVQAASDDGTGGAGVRTGSVTIAGIDPLGGTLTATAAWNSGISAIAASDYLFSFGDYDNVFVGFPGWIVAPGTSITSSPFFGQDRTKNTLLAGWNYAGKGANYEDTITQLCAMINQYDAKLDRIYMNPLDEAQLNKQQSGKIRYDKIANTSDPTLSFEAFTFQHGKGKAAIICDQFVPIGHFFAMSTRSWKLYSNGKICRPANNWVGDMWLQSYTDDVAQARIVTRAFLGSTAPWQNGHGTF